MGKGVKKGCKEQLGAGGVDTEASLVMSLLPSAGTGSGVLQPPSRQPLPCACRGAALWLWCLGGGLAVVRGF